MTLMPPLTGGQGSCLCCPPKPINLPRDAQPHPGFGMLNLTRDGQSPDWWHEYCDIGHFVYVEGAWETGTRHDGSPYEWFTGMDIFDRPSDAVTLAEIEECVAECESGDWRLHIYGAMSEYLYQRHGAGNWVLVEKGMGFA